MASLWAVVNRGMSRPLSVVAMSRMDEGSGLVVPMPTCDWAVNMNKKNRALLSSCLNINLWF